MITYTNLFSMFVTVLFFPFLLKLKWLKKGNWYDAFVLLKLESDNVMRFVTKIVKYLIKNISGNIEAAFFNFGARNTHSVVAKETLLAPGLFLSKTKYP